MSLAHKYIMNSLNTRFNLNLKTGLERPLQLASSSDLDWSYLCMVTQDWDELNEFIYSNELTLSPPIYFNPQSKWGGLFLPKIKLKWTNRAKQVSIGCQIYNVFQGTWDSGTFTINGTSMAISPYFPSEIESNIVLIPLKTYKVTNIIPGTDLPLKIGNETLECVYAAMHCAVNFNRQGLYINRKFRDKIELVQLSELPDKYCILEPMMIEFKAIDGTNGLIINFRG